MRGRLKVRSQLVSEVVREALAEDHEVCGFLLGVVDDDFEVVDFYRIKNVSPISQVRFEVDSRGVYEAHKYAEELGLEVMGIYHSHPGPPIPSTIDLEGMKNWPIVWLIISSVDGSMAAYIMDGGSVRGLEVSLE